MAPSPNTHATWSARWLIPTTQDVLLYIPLVAGLLVTVLFEPSLGLPAVRYALFLFMVVVPLGEAISRRTLPTLAPALRQSLAPVLGTSFVALFEAFPARLGHPSLGVLLWPLALAAMVDRCRQDDPRPPQAGEIRRYQALLSAIVVAVMLGASVLPSLPPTTTHPALIYQDMVWTVGNTEAIAQWGLPLRDLRFDGFHFGYHVGQNLLGVARMVSVGGSAFSSVVTFDAIAFAWMFPVTLVASAVAWLELSTAAAVMLTVVLCLTDSLVGGVQSNTYPAPISYAFSLSPLVAVSALVIGHLRGRATIALVPLALLYFGAVSGKLTLIGLWPAGCLAGLAWHCRTERRGPTSTEWRAIVTLVGTTVVTVLLMRDSIGIGVPTPWPPLPASRLTQLLSGPLHVPFLVPLAHVIGRFVRSLMALLSWLPVTLLLLAAVGTAAARRATWRDPGMGLWVGFGLASLGLNAVLYFQGGDSYFLLYTEVMGAIALADRFDALWSTTKGRAATLVSLAAGLVCFVVAERSFWQRWGLLPWSTEKVWDERATVAQDEWDACLWLHDHSPPSAHFLSNRRYFRHEKSGEDLARVFWCSALAGRVSWVEGIDFMPPPLVAEAARRRQVADRVFSLPADERDALLATLPVQYLVQSLRFGGAPLPTSPHLVLRHETPSARVYEVVGSRDAGQP